MTIIIDSGKTRRQINGTFRICGSRDDLQNLVDTLTETLDNPFIYGWTTVYANTGPKIGEMVPVPWDAPGVQ